MKTSESIAQLADALSKAHGEFTPLVKDMVNPFFKSKYSSLAACHDSTKEALCKYGLMVIQGQVEENNKEYCEIRVTHKSGEWISSIYPIRRTKEDAQGFGAGFTYALRYSYMGMLGLAPEDDDGELAAGRVTEVKEKPLSTVQKTDPTNHKIATTKTATKEIPNAAQNLKLDANGCVRLKMLASSNGWTDDQLNDYLDRYLKVPMLKDLKVSEATHLANIIKGGSYEQAVSRV